MFVGDTPAAARATEILVKAVAVLPNVVIEGADADPTFCPPAGAPLAWTWPGSVTVAVCVWLGRAESAEPPFELAE